MFPNMSKADIEVVKIHWQGLHDEAARHRLSNNIPVGQRGNDWTVFARQMAVVLIGIGLLAAVLLQPWVERAPVVAEAPLPAAAVMAEEPSEAVLVAVAADAEQ